MKTEKWTREDHRGEVFSGQVIVGYPRKPMIPADKSLNATIDGKKQ